MYKKSFAIGCAILMLSNIITRFMGFYYRILMSKTIGAEAIGLYQLIMPLYILCYSLTASGITTTISKLTAEETAKRNDQNAAVILRVSIFIALSLSLAVSFFMYFNSGYISSEFIKDSRSALPIKILSLCFPFMAVCSCIKGYFLGKQSNIFPAMAQIFEQLIRMLSLMAITGAYSPTNISEACAAAATAVVMGEIFSFLLTVFFLFSSHSKKTSCAGPKLGKISAFKKISHMALPLTSSRAASSFLSAIENILIPLRLSMYPKSTNALSQYGNLTGLIMPLVHFPSSLLSAVSVSMIPAISKQRTVKNQISAQNTINKSICFTAAVSCGSSLFFYVFSNEICSIIYSLPELGTMLKMLSALCPIMYMHITLNGILNSLGKHFYLFINGIISSFVNIGFIYFFMPKVGVDAFLYGALFSSLSRVIPALIISGKYFHIKRITAKYFTICFICAIFSSITGKYIIGRINCVNIYGQMISMMASYFFSLIITGVVSDITGFSVSRFCQKRPLFLK